MLAGCTTTPPPVAAVSPPPAAPTPEFQYLYGSGEAAALSVQAYNILVAYARTAVANRPADSVVLAPGATPASPSFVPCGTKPFAAVFDVDETMILNLGGEEKAARRGPGPFDTAEWDRFEKTGANSVAPVPGAVSAVNALRAMGVTVIFNTNRAIANAAGAEAALTAAGLGPAKHGETLFLSGDDAMGSKKDGRRATIAAKYCVIAMGGDQLGDFSDQFNAISSVPARRTTALGNAIAGMWGKGWFVLPNPVYGSAIKGGFDDIFPIDKRWTDPAAKERK